MNWGALDQAIFIFNSFAWVINVCLMCLAHAMNASLSTRVSLMLWSTLDLVVLAVTPVIYNLSEIDVPLTRLVWYPTFAFIPLSMMLIITWMHIKFRLEKSEITKLVMLMLMITIFINVFRFFDRIIIGTDLLKSFYTYGIMSVKAMSALLFFWFLAVKERRSKLAN